jgi:hypothetical protein
MSYIVYLSNGRIIRESDNKEIFRVDGDPDFVEFTNWVASGNTPVEYGNDPADFGESPDITTLYIEVIQNHLDTVAKSRGYDGILSLCSYATSKSLRFSIEAQAGVEWRDAVWEHAYTVLAAVKSGTRPLPTLEDLLVELPVINWV